MFCFFIVISTESDMSKDKIRGLAMNPLALADYIPIHHCQDLSKKNDL